MQAVIRVTKQANLVGEAAGVRCAYRAEKSTAGHAVFLWMFFRGESCVARTRHPEKVVGIAERLVTAK